MSGFRLGLVGCVALAVGLAAQGGQGGQQGGAGGGFGSGAGEAGGSVRALTRFEQFVGKLKLDKKTQAPLVTPILQETAKDATPVGQRMIEVQNQLVAAILANKSEAELQPLLDACTASAATMTGLEAGAFAKIHAMLKPNQQSGSVEAFDLMAGWFQPAAQTSGGRGGIARARMEILTDTLTLTKDQEKAIKTVITDAEKRAVLIKEGLAGTRPPIVAAIQAGKPQPEIGTAVNAYAVQAASMATLEMQTLAGMIRTLTPEQRANQAALRAAFFLMRGAFVGKHFDEVPNSDRGY